MGNSRDPGVQSCNSIHNSVNLLSSSSPAFLPSAPRGITATRAPSFPSLILIHLPNLGSLPTAATTTRLFVAALASRWEWGSADRREGEMSWRELM